MDRKKILVIDDEKVYADTLKVNLEATGKYKVFIETEASTAIATAQKVNPDLILLDLLMPEVDGYFICKHLKDHAGLSRIPIIIVSGKADETDMVSCLGMGADDYMTKPFLVDELDARIRAVLSRSDRIDR